MQKIQTSKLFVASCLSLLVTSLSFGIRAGLLGVQATHFHLNSTQIGEITATAFYGFPIAVIIGGMVVDAIGMKKLLLLAFIFHLIGIVLTIFANGYWTLYISTFLIGIANGTVEAACNPLVTSLYTDNKTTKLNHFHLWFPAGLVLGTLVVFGLDSLLGHGATEKPYWIPQVEIAVMLIPTLIYGYLFSKLDFPPTERVAAGITTGDMYKALGNPLFIFMIICMFGTAITELFINQETGVLFRSATTNPILVLTFVASMQVLGRAFAAPIVHRLAPQGVLLMSAILATAGVYLFLHLQGSSIFLAAVIFGLGIAFFWPCMIGFVSENLPRTGAVGLNLMGGAGMLAVSIYMIFMGGYYDQLTIKHLPAGANLADYVKAPDSSPMGMALAHAKDLSAPDVLSFTSVIPVILIFAFIGLVIYMRVKHKKALAA